MLAQFLAFNFRYDSLVPLLQRHYMETKGNKDLGMGNFNKARQRHPIRTVDSA